MRISDLPHLTRRFFGSLGSRWPAPADQRWVAERLDEDWARLFFSQALVDQGHALRVARRVAGKAPGREDLVRAALLHDVGKSESRLGVVGRSLASVLAILRVPPPRWMRTYLDHGALGAETLARAGADPLTVAFARWHHHRTAPTGVSATDWEALRRADAE